MPSAVKPLVVAPSANREDPSMHQEIEAPVPTRPNLFGSLVESGVSTVRAVPKLPVQSKRLVPNLERPYHLLDRGRIRLYRVQPRGKTMFYVVEVDGYEIGPLTLIQDVKFDRGRYFIRIQPDVIEIPEALRDVVFIHSMIPVSEIGFTDHCIFVSPEVPLEQMQSIMLTKYPRESLAPPKLDVRSYATTYLVIAGSE